MDFDWYPNYAAGQQLIVANNHWADNQVFDAINMTYISVGQFIAGTGWVFKAPANQINAFTNWLANQLVTTH